MPVERFTDSQGRLFIKAPLINNLVNQRGWRVTPEANERFAKTAIGKPVTVMIDKMESRFYDYHPFARPKIDPMTGLAEEPNSGEHSKYAAKWGYGIVREVGTTSSIYKAASGEIPWFFTYEVIEPTAKEELSKDDTKLIPPAYSPGILHIEGADDAVSEYEIVHIASVPTGAFGPRFVTLGKCQGDAISCLPQLKSASYKDRTGGCPKDAFSSLLVKGASSDNKMSLQGVEVPAPTQPANSSVKPDNQSAIKTQGGQPQGQQSTNKKVTIKINRIQRQNSSEPGNGNGDENNNEKGGGEGESGEGNNQAQTESTNRSEGQRIAELERHVKAGDTRYFVEGVLRKYPHLFNNNAGRYQEKKYQEKVQEYTDKIMNGELSPAMAQKLIDLEARVPMLEVKRASSPIEDFIAPAIQPKGASSLEDDETTQNSRMLARGFRTYLDLGGS